MQSDININDTESSTYMLLVYSPSYPFSSIFRESRNATRRVCTER